MQKLPVLKRGNRLWNIPFVLDLKNYCGSLMFLPSAPSVCGERLSSQIVRCDHKYTLGLRNIIDPQIPARCSLAKRKPRAIPAGAILASSFKNVDNLVLFHLMIMYVRRACRRVDIESGSQMYFLILTLFRFQVVQART